MKLYYSPGVCSQSVHIALNEAGIEHLIEKVDLANKTTESGTDYSRVNPLGYVPALELDDGEVLLEAPAILQYVADLKPETSLAPANGTRERVRLQAELNYTASELHKSFGPFFAPVKPAGALKEQALAKLAKRFDALEAKLSDGRDYIMGRDFTVADTYTFVVASWAGLIGFDLSGYPHVRAYIERVRARPKVLETLKREGLAA
ncbi:MAG TPA: glutathione transferase GstA [Amaricoccus sp.]|uniref:glutathione transferase GstA n=1 Tax=Amaricoccus sp. TaxID=1872485 RepID=UPI002CA4C944|nr:glutathione transferase GstA [Amaricoccus sp.]HMQ93470.1 glutathione transferase GstA [Amaricoccus sp.]HMR53669.1 glutathione transferase GstA [Amaricoccus sp.]HMU00733.1 glutathione transferase GstA [Amaricoccus sp.]